MDLRAAGSKPLFNLRQVGVEVFDYMLLDLARERAPVVCGPRGRESPEREGALIEGVKRAREAVTSGKALAKLSQFVAATNRFRT